jgi:hypothetical protein
MKSLEKERTRRYETVNGFARDIERFLPGRNKSIASCCTGRHGKSESRQPHP